ncbi:MAG: hypothetical protein A3G52_01605 [Candidatus Taylorbacteria bacterium RIFCSPLOWO2_12_FULL_43_20]|uniref:Uncharacterized protein n=1 Tax=Candidatus Taylorbacteria bacterium RIFCSPLOWO2_12_FULL_43_20 TaxID=1802332 RepID=A0A1G2NZY8_9BACT|nr:MAG: hypothetical protein A2825_00115 [Candidatus Taylorbacteria bacterium RIFCSPHIGHO2_01_FULL_43_120]OHA22127.1 MAG: hypothetical protein A3B98_03765 [Candidatus Taylorbacteria bacterium RIFCSPHIGHO2_02_FULL_43_55]OHA30421.1 MAG: hypothetical protein A3E92_04215 [Candidatus Taylorbacteria bacterium RIFCSPHIGHO2_12_FULL_42_34]OHA32378.1 MAG: hypothetical protein A3B09_03765 [Candidatus Taylorbacteria bacterium RIFCSPLOWO2_01_FULL_43_83]OHA37813.1 MAG: hypothetical protein A3H58_02835 [Candi
MDGNNYGLRNSFLGRAFAEHGYFFAKKSLEHVPNLMSGPNSKILSENGEARGSIASYVDER